MDRLSRVQELERIRCVHVRSRSATVHSLVLEFASCLSLTCRACASVRQTGHGSYWGATKKEFLVSDIVLINAEALVFYLSMKEPMKSKKNPVFSRYLPFDNIDLGHDICDCFLWPCRYTLVLSVWPPCIT